MGKPTVPGAWFRPPTARGQRLREPQAGRPLAWRSRQRLMRAVLRLQDKRDQLDSETRDAWEACTAAGIGAPELYAFAETLDGPDDPAEAVA